MLNKLPIKTSILLLSIIPLLLLTTILTVLVTRQSYNVVERGINSFEKLFYTSKKQELINYLNISLTAAEHLSQTKNLTEQDQQEILKSYFRDLNYGKDNRDGYFFIYDFQGTNLVLPRMPEYVGKNWWNLRDSQGNLLIQELIRQSQQGGGFYRYLWPKPSAESDIGVDKISYAAKMPGYEWMVGTGIYLDDINQVIYTFNTELSSTLRDTTYIILALTLTALVIISFIGIAIHISEGKSADTKLKRLTHSVLMFQEEERSRVARELHDGIVQLLVSSKYQMETSKAASGTLEKPQQHIEKSLAIIDKAIIEIKRISRGLRPTSLDDLGLFSAVAWLAEEFESRTNIPTRVIGNVEPDQFSNEVTTAYYRITQEALTNIEKHSDADKVVIRFRTISDTLIMTIKDNGKGFDQNSTNNTTDPLDYSGTGLHNMRERMELLNGEFRIVSIPGKGTLLKLKYHH